MAPEKWTFGNNQWPFRPTREMEEMRRRWEEDVVRPAMHAVLERIPAEIKGWSPALDMFERGDSLEIKVELPGVKQEDVDVSLANDMLVIKGERKMDSGVKAEDYTRSEIAFGSFYRSIPLPPNADVKNIEAMYEDGILTIKLQRVAGAKPKKVNVAFKKPASA
jgi:HSP20 family protein